MGSAPEKSIPGRGINPCKGPEVGTYLAGVGNSSEVGRAERSE